MQTLTTGFRTAIPTGSSKVQILFMSHAQKSKRIEAFGAKGESMTELMWYVGMTTDMVEEGDFDRKLDGAGT